MYPFLVSASVSSSTAPTDYTASIALTGEQASAAIWHKCLRPPSLSTLQSLLSSFPLKGTTAAPFCEFSRYAKSCKLPFSTSDTVTSFPLQLVHSDVCGPAPILSMCGFKYYVVFIDDFTKYTWMFPLHCKSEGFSAFLRFKFQVENLLSLRIKTFQSDGGGEFF